MIIQPSSIKRTTLIQNAQAILSDRYRLRSGQQILVLYDREKKNIGRAFACAARQLGIKADIFY